MKLLIIVAILCFIFAAEESFVSANPEPCPAVMLSQCNPYVSFVRDDNGCATGECCRDIGICDPQCAIRNDEHDCPYCHCSRISDNNIEY
ncbi:hypothetical protein BsWGS_19442 [Bradybaena similaris]